MELLFELFFWPLFGILQAVVGILWPSDDPGVRRLQRLCQFTLLTGVAAFAVAIVLAYIWPSGNVLLLLAIACIFFIVSGILGNRIENVCKRKP
jgi:hypothetical protein